MGVTLVTTFAEWRRGLVAIGVPDWLSWVISTPRAMVIGYLFLAFVSAARGVAGYVETLWGGLIWLGCCLLGITAVGAFYIWVYQQGGGVDVMFP